MNAFSRAPLPAAGASRAISPASPYFSQALPLILSPELPSRWTEAILRKGDFMKLRRDPLKWLEKKSKGFRGYPDGTIAFYGPDNQRASKVAVGVIAAED